MRSSSQVLNIFCLALVTVIYRAVVARWPNALPDFSPMMALSLVSSVYLARQFGALVAPCVFLVTELFYLAMHRQDLGTVFSVWVLLGPALYLILGWSGNFFIQSERTLGKFMLCSLISSLAFYLATNTVCWWASPDYPQTLAGWVQANTTGVPGYLPAWLFLRNSAMGDFGFTLLFLTVLEPTLYGRFRPAAISEETLAGNS